MALVNSTKSTNFEHRDDRVDKVKSGSSRPNTVSVTNGKSRSTRHKTSKRTKTKTGLDSECAPTANYQHKPTERATDAIDKGRETQCTGPTDKRIDWKFVAIPPSISGVTSLPKELNANSLLVSKNGLLLRASGKVLTIYPLRRDAEGAAPLVNRFSTFVFDQAMERWYLSAEDAFLYGAVALETGQFRVLVFDFQVLRTAARSTAIRKAFISFFEFDEDIKDVIPNRFCKNEVAVLLLNGKVKFCEVRPGCATVLKTFSNKLPTQEPFVSFQYGSHYMYAVSEEGKLFIFSRQSADSMRKFKPVFKENLVNCRVLSVKYGGGTATTTSLFLTVGESHQCIKTIAHMTIKHEEDRPHMSFAKFSGHLDISPCFLQLPGGALLTLPLNGTAQFSLPLSESPGCYNPVEGDFQLQGHNRHKVVATVSYSFNHGLGQTFVVLLKANDEMQLYEYMCTGQQEKEAARFMKRIDRVIVEITNECHKNRLEMDDLKKLVTENEGKTAMNQRIIYEQVQITQRLGKDVDDHLKIQAEINRDLISRIAAIEGNKSHRRPGPSTDARTSDDSFVSVATARKNAKKRPCGDDKKQTTPAAASSRNERITGCSLSSMDEEGLESTPTVRKKRKIAVSCQNAATGKSLSSKKLTRSPPGGRASKVIRQNKSRGIGNFLRDMADNSSHRVGWFNKATNVVKVPWGRITDEDWDEENNGLYSEWNDEKPKIQVPLNVAAAVPIADKSNDVRKLKAAFRSALEKSKALDTGILSISSSSKGDFLYVTLGSKKKR